jgi:two-component system, chemotaxis family, protein-glutamate methylesterase/glutaminase
MPIKVVVADDSDVMRRAIRRLLEEHPDIELVGEASNFGETVRMWIELRPQVIVMDLNMKNDAMTISDVKAHLNGSDTPVVAISFANNETAKELANDFGAVTLLDKTELDNELIRTIKKFASRGLQ